MHKRATHIEGTQAGQRRGRRRRTLTTLVSLGVFGLAASTAAQAPATIYVPNYESDTVSAYSISANGDLSQVPGSPFKASAPLGAAITPDGKYLYVANFTWSGTVSAFSILPDGSLSPVTGSPFPAGPGAWGVAITPDGGHLYVANDGGNDVSAYSIASNGSLTAVPGSPFAAGTEPNDLAITPDGQHLYVTNQGSNDVSVSSIASDGALNEVSGSPYPTGKDPRALSLTPDGSHLYVANLSSGYITAFSIDPDGTLGAVEGSPFTTAEGSHGLDVTPDGKHLYAASDYGPDEGISAYSIAANGSLGAVSESRFPSGGNHDLDVAATPDSRYLYVTNYGEFEQPGEGSVSELSIARNGGLSTLPGSPFAAGEGPIELVVAPDEGPEAAFTPAPTPAGDPTTFDASTSGDPDYPLATYEWDFGDGHTETTSSATTTHAYGAAGTYAVTLTVIDAAGCSTAQIFTGQTVSCNGSPRAEISHQVTVPDGLRLAVSSNGSGSGSVASTPLGLACPGTCSHAYEPDTQVILTATAAAGSRFAGWEGAGCSGTSACQMALSSEATVTATFEKLPILSVSITGSGSGSLESAPSGIACPGACSQAYLPGTQVTLTPIAMSGSRFAGWEGASCSGIGPCQVMVSSGITVTARFATIPTSALHSGRARVCKALEGAEPSRAYLSPHSASYGDNTLVYA
jgi:YVTN family beta-propeller protein